MPAFQHMFQTWTVSLNWALRANAQGIQDTNTIIKRSDEEITRGREAQLKANRESEQRTHELAAAFGRRMGERDIQAENFRDHVTDEQQVRSAATGATFKAPAGYKYYYLDPATGAISGTDSPDVPPVNLELLGK